MRIGYVTGLLIVLSSCRPPAQPEMTTKALPEKKDTTEIIKFFPVTEYILGQITEIKMQGINPLKKTGADSSWIRIEDLEREMSDFLHPVIDTSNMANFFLESRFLDQTIDAYTFFYEPKPNKPDSISLQRWIIYVDPKKNKVKTVIMEKKEKDINLFLTWEADKYCKILQIKEDDSGNAIPEKEITINWDF